MRIISGTAKGRKLTPLAGRSNSIRPTSDRAREALFSILGNRAKHANVLDLFAGTGSVGLEAFSRKAKSVTFVESDNVAMDILKKNVLLCFDKYTGSCEIKVIKHDLSKGLPLHKLHKTHNIHKKSDIAFEFIFADPPYSVGLSTKILDLVNESNILSKDGLLVIEERFDVDLPSAYANIALKDKRTYGEATFWFYEPAN